MALIDLIRHGETDVTGLLLGRTDRPLSRAGWRQFGRQTAGRRYGRIVSSPLLRTREPAERFALAHGFALSVDPDWIELDFGVWDGLPLKELQSGRDGFAAIYQSADTPAPPGGESWSALTDRITRALRALADEGAVAPTLIVTHGGPIRAALAVACDIPFERLWAFRIDYATRLTLRIGSEAGSRLWGEIVEIAQP